MDHAVSRKSNFLSVKAMNNIFLKWILGVLLIVAVFYIGHFIGFPENKMINPEPLWDSFQENPFFISLIILLVPALYIYYFEKKKK
jgi:hypothetical protein